MSIRRFPHKSFVDRCTLKVMGGRGGDGCVSYQHLAPGRKSPNGGHGGRGGDVKLLASNNVRDLTLTSFHVEAEPGSHGSSNGRVGRQGRMKELRVPTGTVVYRKTSYADEQRVLFADLNVVGDEVIVARGGSPGLGNILKAQSSFQFYQRELKPHEKQGKPGEEMILDLELKTIADVGFVGYPNAGKSSLLGAISKSKPKVAPYPFTTLHPMLGHLEFSDSRRITVADLPGLVDGAHENKGLGHAFLQHIERTRVIVYVIDVSNERAQTWTRGHLDPGQDLLALAKELDLYEPGLSDFPTLVVANKMDLDGAKKGLQDLQGACDLLWRDKRPIPISAITSQGLEEFVTELRMVVDDKNVVAVHDNDDADENVVPSRSSTTMAQGVVIGKDVREPRMTKGVGHRRAIMLKKLRESRGEGWR